MRAGPLGQELQRRAVGVGQLTRNVEPQPRSARPRREKWLEDLPPQLGRNPRTIIVEFAYYGIPHVTGAQHDADAAVLLLAVLPRVAHEVPDDLVEVAAVEHHQQVFRRPHHDPPPAGSPPPGRSPRRARL